MEIEKHVKEDRTIIPRAVQTSMPGWTMVNQSAASSCLLVLPLPLLRFQSFLCSNPYSSFTFTFTSMTPHYFLSSPLSLSPLPLLRVFPSSSATWWAGGGASLLGSGLGGNRCRALQDVCRRRVRS